MYCWNCFSKMEQNLNGWKCPKCGTALTVEGLEYEPDQETKADCIRRFSDDSLADLLFDVSRDRKARKKSKKEWLEWLKSLREED